MPDTTSSAPSGNVVATPPTAPPTEPPLSEPARIIDTFIAPTKTFNDIRHNASWWVPWLLIAIFSLAFVWVMGQKIGFEQIVRSSIQQSSRAEQFEKLSAEQQEAQLATATKITAVFSYATPIIQLLIFALMAAVLMATFNFGMGAEIPFKNSMAVVTYSQLPGLVAAIIGMVSLYAGVDPEGFNPRNPVASNPAYFMDATAHKFLYGMASALDVFVIWTIILMAIGYSSNSKVKRSTAFAVIIGWYLLFKIVASGISAL